MAFASIDAAIVTVTYNCQDFIESFLAAVKEPLLRQTPALRLIVVDNQSSDQTIAVVRRFVEVHGLEQRVVIAPQDENLGFGRGCNAGVEQARRFHPRFYWFLNPDTQVFPDTGDELMAFFEREASADFVGSRLENGEAVPRPSAFRFPSIQSEFCRSLRLGLLDRLLSRGQLALPVSDEAHRADWLTGASFMVKAEVFDQLKGFDPAYFLYFEEVDLFYRARQSGYNCWINPGSRVYHYAGASTGIASNRKASRPRPQYWFDSRRYFYCKNFGRVYFALCDVAAISGLALWNLRAQLQRKDSKDPPGLLRDLAANSIFSRGRNASRL